MDQLHEIIKHVTSRIEEGDEWTVGRYPLGVYAEHQIKTVDEVISETNHTMIAECWSRRSICTMQTNT